MEVKTQEPFTETGEIRSTAVNDWENKIRESLGLNCMQNCHGLAVEIVETIDEALINNRREQ